MASPSVTRDPNNVSLGLCVCGKSAGKTPRGRKESRRKTAGRHKPRGAPPLWRGNAAARTSKEMSAPPTGKAALLTSREQDRPRWTSHAVACITVPPCTGMRGRLPGDLVGGQVTLKESTHTKMWPNGPGRPQSTVVVRSPKNTKACCAPSCDAHLGDP